MAASILTDLNRFLKGEIDINHINDEYGLSLIGALIAGNCDEIAIRYIAGADVHRIYQGNCTLLELSIMNHQERIKKILIEMGSPIRERTFELALLYDMSNDFIFDTFNFESFSRDNSEYVRAAYMTGRIKVLQKLLDLNFAVPSNILLVKFTNRGILTPELGDLAVELFNRGGGTEYANMHTTNILIKALSYEFEELAVRIIEKYHQELTVNSEKNHYLYFACQNILPKAVSTLIKYGSPYDKKLEKLNFSSNKEIARMLADAYPEFPIRFVNNLDDVKFAEKTDRQRIETLVSSAQVGANMGTFPQLPVELQEIIIRNMDAQIAPENPFAMIPVFSPPRNPFATMPVSPQQNPMLTSPRQNPMLTSPRQNPMLASPRQNPMLASPRQAEFNFEI